MHFSIYQIKTNKNDLLKEWRNDFVNKEKIKKIISVKCVLNEKKKSIWLFIDIRILIDRWANTAKRRFHSSKQRRIYRKSKIELGISIYFQLWCAHISHTDGSLSINEKITNIHFRINTLIHIFFVFFLYLGNSNK